MKKSRRDPRRPPKAPEIGKWMAEQMDKVPRTPDEHILLVVREQVEHAHEALDPKLLPTAATIARGLGRRTAAGPLYQELDNLVVKGALLRMGAGRPGDPYRYIPASMVAR